MSQKQVDKALFYESEYNMFNNFSAFAVEYRGVIWPTSEHAYQAAKFTDPRITLMIQESRSAHDSKKIAHAYENQVREDWGDVKLLIMQEILENKLSQHPYIQKKLLETGDKEIVEDSPTDSFWGRGPDWKGENNLGKIWMKLRQELKNASVT